MEIWALESGILKKNGLGNGTGTPPSGPSNHEPQASGFTAKFWTFYGVTSMVYKSVDQKIVVA